jgi:hypothetical protein
MAVATSIRAQNTTASGQQGQALTEQQVRDEVQQLISDMDDPNNDYSTIPSRVDQVTKDVHRVARTMAPEDGIEFQMELVQQVAPVVQRNQQRLQQAVQEEAITKIVQSLQKPLGSSDEEFSALTPSLRKVVVAMVEASILSASSAGVDPSGGQQDRQISAVEQAAQELQSALNDPNADPNSIRGKLEALRSVKSKAEQDLKLARQALRSLLTVRQEAVLVIKEILD